ncbi:ParB N-terminal domain-containing protein [Mycobacterium sp.]|jgi:ParB family transcriptional regulator, chromosome partitioning protein|uniref:ParB/RepB/Spo0J family partition protein n=1 Tax=Mycobacterium sp. TaxID=1785 RepID=UPI0025E2FE06|nr:ParB N-terminal domain-containing protein [Mycobacterium sp.]
MTATSPAPELIHLSPNEVEIEDNVRLDPRLDRDFLASIQEHGVLVPVLAVRIDGQDKPFVREGQRRIQAARQIGLQTVPVYLRSVDGTESAVRAQRVIEQMVTNDHRAPLTEAERARGIAQLLLDGVSPTKVAKELSTTKDAIAAAKVAIESHTAMSALDAGQLNLVEATSFVEFDGDDTAQAELIKVAGTDQFDHRVAQLRAEREDRRRYEETAAAFSAKGYTVLEHRPGWSDKAYIPTGYLRDAEGEPLTDEKVAEMDPQHWAVVLETAEVYLDVETGEPVNEDDIDFDTADDPTLEPAEGYRHIHTVTETTDWRPEYYCCNPRGAKVTMPDWAARQYGFDADRLADAGDPDGAAERERARQEEADKERAERRKLIALNKLGEAAAIVRREWVRDKLLSRKTAPKGTALYLAEVVVTRPDLFNDYHGQKLAPELLGLADTETAKMAVAKLPATGDGRALVILLGMVLATTEARTAKDAWRGPQDITKTYLRFLEDNDYTLSDIEQVILGKRKADTLYRQICKED